MDDDVVEFNHLSIRIAEMHLKPLPELYKLLPLRRSTSIEKCEVHQCLLHPLRGVGIN